MKLSENFTLAEMIRSQTASRKGINNTPSEDIIENLKWTCELLEEIRKACGNKPLFVSSGYRSPGLNTAIGGSPTSQHCLGLAADFKIPGLSLDLVIKTIKEKNLAYDQLILEFGSWIHVSRSPRPRREHLIIDSKGVRHAN